MQNFKPLGLLGLFWALSASVALAQTNAYIKYGDSISDRYGIALAAGGDINADGYDDFILGSPYDDPNPTNSPGRGVAKVFSGFDGAELFSFGGSSFGGLFGGAVGGAGDVNGDGYDDIIVGAASESSNAVLAGAAFVYSGFDGSVLYSYLGTVAYELMGGSVAGLGDIDGDGMDDFAIAASEYSAMMTGPGRVRVYSGATGSLLATLVGDSVDEGFGISLAGAGDVDADGVPDIVVGAPFDDNNFTNSGNVKVFSGQTFLILYSFDGDQNSSTFGLSCDGAGDVNRDGYADIIVGAPGHDGVNLDIGRVKIFSGFDGSVIHSRDGTLFREQMGVNVAGLGDVDGDGYDDVAIGVFGPLSQPLCKAYVLSGATGNNLHVLTGPAASLYGSKLSRIGDINRDGFADILVGAPFDNTVAANAGAAIVVQMPTLDVLSYDGGGHPGLLLDWIPQSTANPLQGSLSGSQATPFAMGFYLVGYAPAAISVFGVDLLVAVDPTNLVESGTFMFDATGSHMFANVSRQAPFIAGSQIHIQWFETSPNIVSSNGIRLLMTL